MLLASLSRSVIIRLVFFLAGFARTSCNAIDHHRGKRSIPRLASRFVPAYSDEAPLRMSIENMTCSFFTQPLDHFAPRGKSPTFQQRYCIYDGYAANATESGIIGRAPILLYTGNESPLEQYINHTGLMWELAPQLHARVVFVEHRYEGQSVPNLTKNCLAYGSTMQALADYADILQLHLNRHSENNDPIAPVIAFGGSYGGMLSAWMRMKYPHLVAGAIAASAPIGAFPQQANHNMDGATRVLAHGIQQSYPPDKESNGEENNHCLTNLLATWPLIAWLVQEDGYRESARSNRNSSISRLQDPASFLQDVFRLCEPYTSSNPEPLVSRFFRRSESSRTVKLRFFTHHDDFPHRSVARICHHIVV
jgi:lysosomal Pro-X carboxypeptidase